MFQIASVNSDEANIRYDLKRKSTHKDLGREYRLKNVIEYMEILFKYSFKHII